MALNFPTNPSDGDTFTLGGATYTYESATDKWVGSFSAGGGGGGGGEAGTIEVQMADTLITQYTWSNQNPLSGNAENNLRFATPVTLTDSSFVAGHYVLTGSFTLSNSGSVNHNRRQGVGRWEYSVDGGTNWVAIANSGTNVVSAGQSGSGAISVSFDIPAAHAGTVRLRMRWGPQNTGSQSNVWTHTSTFTMNSLNVLIYESSNIDSFTIGSTVVA